MNRFRLSKLVMLCLSFVVCLAAAQAAAADTSQIVGDWHFGGGEVRVAQGASGALQGVVVEPVTFAQCTHPVGEVIWQLQGSGASFSGTHEWVSGKCDSYQPGDATWQITDTSSTQHTMTFCTAYPGTGAPDPTATPSHDAGSTQCFALTEALAVYSEPSPPVDGTPPSISGTAASGQVLTCSPGTWSNDPTGYTYQWNVNGTPVTGATNSMFSVPTEDQGKTLTCTVIAYNLGGAGQPATSPGVLVAKPAATSTPSPSSGSDSGSPVPGCPLATGKVTSRKLGLAVLGMTRQQVLHAYRFSNSRRKRYEEFFCLTPRGVRVGLASPLLTKRLTRNQKLAIRSRVVWVSTSNHYYSLAGIRPDTSLAAAKARLRTRLSKPFYVGKNTWYLVRYGRSTGILKTRGGVVQEIGIGASELLVTHPQQKAFLRSFF